MMAIYLYVDTPFMLLSLRPPQPVGRILESDTGSQNKVFTSLWPMAKRRIQESDLRGWCCRTAFIFKVIFWIGITQPQTAANAGCAAKLPYWWR